MNARRVSTRVCLIVLALGLLVPSAGAGTIAYEVDPGTIGNQAFAGSLGMDFDTTPNQWVMVTHLGVFDSASDGLNRPITAYIYDRTTQTAVVSMAFPTGSGTLIGGSRFQALPAPLYLPPGFQGSVVAENYGTSEPDGNSATPTNWHTNDGGGILSFVGQSRWGTAGAYPVNAGSIANEYAAGTFMFDASESQVGLPFSVPNHSFETPAHGTPGGWSPTVPGWTTSGAGNYHPTATDFTDPIPDGNQIAFINSGWLTSDPLGQTLQADTLYILDVDWGRRASSTATPSYGMALNAGGAALGWVNNTSIQNGPTPGVGEFVSARGYFTANHNAALGSDLQIHLSGGNPQIAFDNVRLTKLTGAAVPLVNPSFELPDVAGNGGWSPSVPGWTPAGSGTMGVYENPSQIIAADGSQVLFITPSGSMTQTLTGVPLEGNHRYFLLVDVGDRDSTASTGYTVELLAGGQTVAIDNNSLLVQQYSGQPGRFLTTSVIDIFVPDGHPLVGQDLGIRLGALTGGTQTYFDNVRLFSVLVPEPSSMALALLGVVALAGCGWRRRKR